MISRHFGRMLVIEPRRVLPVPLLAAICVAGACASDAPTPVAPTSSINGLTISGLPPALAPGQSVQLTASVALSSGAQKQILDATWQSSNSAVATVSPTGVVTIADFGEAEILVSAYGKSATARAFAPLPPRIRLTKRYDSHGSTVGLCNATSVTFDLSASTGAGLRYDVSFGDGLSSSDMVSRHVFACLGAPFPRTHRSIAQATVTDVLGRTDTTTTDVANVFLDEINGPYPWFNGDSGFFRFLRFGRPTGQERRLRGRYWEIQMYPLPYAYLGDTDFTANIGEENDLEIVLDDRTIRMTGHLVLVDSPFNARIVLAFTGDSVDGKTLTFTPYEPF